MIDLRLDPRLLPRLDATDVVQEALADAWGKLSEFFDQPLPFYPWLRQLTWNRLIDLHRRHVHAQKRSVRREETPALTDGSVLELAERLAAADATPSQQVLDRELHERVRQALLQLGERDREILVLRHLEELPVAEAAAVLGITENAAAGGGALSGGERRSMGVRLRAGPTFGRGHGSVIGTWRKGGPPGRGRKFPGSLPW